MAKGDGDQATAIRAEAYRRIGPPAGSPYYFFIVIVVRQVTAATACWALLLIVRTLSNDAITIAVWTGFHVCLPVDTPASLTRKDRAQPRSGAPEAYGRR